MNSCVFALLVSLPPAYEVRREVVFSVCLSVHTRRVGGRYPSARFFPRSLVPDGGTPFWDGGNPSPSLRIPQSQIGIHRGTTQQSQFGVPNTRRGQNRGTPSQDSTGVLPPGQDRTGNPTRPGQDGVPLPPPRPGLGYSSPDRDWSTQQSKYLLHGQRYASCVHAGGLSCLHGVLKCHEIAAVELKYRREWSNNTLCIRGLIGALCRLLLIPSSPSASGPSCGIYCLLQLQNWT